MTLDVVTATLSNGRWQFYLVTKAWTTFATTPKLTWKRVQFSERSRKRVPKTSGLYAFVAKVSNNQLPQHGYVMYVGQTGQISGRTLYDRYGDYLNWAKREKRPVVRDMFKRLNGALSFYFAPVSGRHVADLTKVETKLLDVLVPPCNEIGFSVEIAQARKLLWRK